MRNLQPARLLLASLAFLASCTQQPEEAASFATSTPAELPTVTPPPPTIPPTPTPTPRPISADTIPELSEFLNFDSLGEAIRSLAFSPDGAVLASAGGNTQDFDVRLWDASKGQLLHTLHGHTGIVWNIAFSTDGTMMATASSDGTVRVWDWGNGTLIQTLNFPNEMVGVGFSPDGQTLAAGGVKAWPDAAIWTYSVGNWQPVLQLAEFWNIPDLAYTPDGQLIAGGGTSRNVRVWRASDGHELFTLYHSGQVSSVDISPNGALLATGLCEASDANLQCIRGAVWLWDLASGNRSRQLSDFATWVTTVAYTPDGSVLFAGSRDGTLRAYSTVDFSVLREFSFPSGDGIFALSPDGRLLATLGSNGTIDMWKINPGD